MCCVRINKKANCLADKIRINTCREHVDCGAVRSFIEKRYQLPPRACPCPTHLHAQTDGGQLQLLQLLLLVGEPQIDVVRARDEEKRQRTEQGEATDAAQHADAETQSGIPHAADGALYGHVTIQGDGYQYQAAGHNGGSVGKRHEAAHEVAQ